MAELTTVGSHSEANITRFLLAVEKGQQQCYAEAFDLLYRALGHGRSYATLQEFLVKALGWKEHQLTTLAQQTHLECVTGSSDGEYLISYSDTLTRQCSEQSASVFSEPPSPVDENIDEGFQSSVENVSVSPPGLESEQSEHLIQSPNETLQKNHSVPEEISKTEIILEISKTEIISATADVAALEQQHSSDEEKTDRLLKSATPETVSQASKEALQIPHVSSQQPKKNSQSVQEASCRTSRSRIQPPKTIPQYLKEKEQRPQTKPDKSGNASQSGKETKQTPQGRSNPSRNVSQSMKEPAKGPQSSLQGPTRTSQSVKETSKIPHLKSSCVTSTSHATRKDQKYQFRPCPRKISESSLEETNQADVTSASAPIHSEKNIPRARFTVKKATADHVVSGRQEVSHTTPSEEGLSHVSSPKLPKSKIPQGRQGTTRSTSLSLPHQDTSRAPHIKANLTRNMSQPVRKVDQNQTGSDPRKSNHRSQAKTNAQVISNVTVHSPKLIPGTRFKLKKVCENSVSSAKQETTGFLPSRQATTHAAFPTQVTNHGSTAGESSPVVPLSQETSNASLPEPKEETSHLSLSKQENNVSFPKPAANYVSPFSQETMHASVSKQETSQVSSPKLEASHVSPFKSETCRVSPSKQEASLVPSSKPETCRVSPSKQEASYISPPKQETSHVSSVKPETIHVSLSKLETSSGTPSTLVSSSSVTPFTVETNVVSPPKQETNHSTPADQEAVYIASSHQETCQATPSSEDEVDISDIVDEANQVLKEPGQTRFSLLNAEPVANQLPQEALVLLLMGVFPQLPPKARELIQQLQQFSSVVCYRDMEFSDEQLSLRLQDFSHLIAEIISVVVGCCKNVTSKCIKETSGMLRTAKKRLRSAQKDYKDHLHWVIQTRQELRVAERDLQEAKVKNVKVLRVCSRSQSQESKESDDHTHGKVQGALGHSDPPRVTDSESSILADEQELTEKHQDAASDDNDSLLSSVMREVAVIEKKHSSASEHDRTLKKILRNTQETVIETKKEVRNRLHSNVSAEEEAITKEDSLSEKQAATKGLSKELKMLQSDYKALQANESVIISSIMENIEAVRIMEVDEKTLSLGRLGVQTLREQKSGRLLMESRQEAVAFASLVKVSDLGEWLMLKQDVTTQIEQIYSCLSVNGSKHTMNILDVVGTSDKIPSVVVLCGPAGSGKSCMCYYLLHQWKSNKHVINSKLHQLDLVLYCTMSNILSAGSWSQYLREHVFCTTLTDFPTLDIHEALATMSVLFLIDVGTLTPASSEILKEIFTHLGRNRVLVTARPESERDIVEVVKCNDLSCLSAKLCPMTPKAIKDYASHLFSFFEQQNSSVHDRVDNFTKLLHTMDANDALMYPLPIAYVMYLWRVDPGHALRAKSLSCLFREVVVVCEHTLTEVLRAEMGGDRGAARLRAEQHTQQLYEAAWKQVTHKDWPHHNHAFLPPEHQLLKEQRVFCNFDPLLVVRQGMDGKRQGDLPHHLLAEVLCGFHLARQRLFPKGSSLFRKREKLERHCIPDVKRFRNIIPHTAAALLYSKHTLEDAREVASLYSRSLLEERDMTSWLKLLHECDFLPTMCTAVSEITAQFTCWTTAQQSQENNCAVADMLRRGAYQPQQVVISQASQEGVNCIIHALSTCSSTLVSLRQDAQFYNWGETETSDSLVVPLQPPGTLLECWGHLGVEGAMALRHSHHLEELNVRISSCEALSALVHSMDQIRRSLRYLYLRLDLSPSTPLSSLQPLNFKGKHLWLRVRGITDDSLSWLKSLIKMLNSWYTEVVLEESHLSPSELQDLKESMPQTPVHISG